MDFQRNVVIYYKIHWNLFCGFGDPRGRNLASFITLAIGFFTAASTTVLATICAFVAPTDPGPQLWASWKTHHLCFLNISFQCIISSNSKLSHFKHKLNCKLEITAELRNVQWRLDTATTISGGSRLTRQNARWRRTCQRSAYEDGSCRRPRSLRRAPRDGVNTLSECDRCYGARRPPARIAAGSAESRADDGGARWVGGRGGGSEHHCARHRRRRCPANALMRAR